MAIWSNDPGHYAFIPAGLYLPRCDKRSDFDGQPETAGLGCGFADFRFSILYLYRRQEPRPVWFQHLCDSAAPGAGISSITRSSGTGIEALFGPVECFLVRLLMAKRFAVLRTRVRC